MGFGASGLQRTSEETQLNHHQTGSGREALDLELPAPPATLVRMSSLLADPVCDLDSLSELIEGDMTLAAALLRTVNSAFFRLSGRVQTVREAITYLGCREVAAITLQQGLRAAFPAAVELEDLWLRAGERSRWMGVVANALGFDAWAAHSAGLFEECGKALLFRHAPSECRELWARSQNDDAMLAAHEMVAFGASHDILGAALCETWGLQASAVHSVRHHLEFQATLALRGPATHRAVAAVSTLAHHASSSAADFERCMAAVAGQLDLTPARVRSVIPAGRTCRAGRV